MRHIDFAEFGAYISAGGILGAAIYPSVWACLAGAFLGFCIATKLYRGK